MSAGLDKIRERVADFLAGHGVQTVTAWPNEARTRRDGAVAAVSVRKCQGGPSGFQDYLGERYDPESGRWEELYGKRVSITFGLDLYADTQAGEGAIQSAFDAIAAAFQQDSPEGLEVQEFGCGETAYDAAGRMLKRSVEAICTAYLYAVTEPGGAFLDFEIRGGIKQ